jgi:hypothetical protein
MPQPQKCFEFMNCDGLRRENCPAFKKGNALSCWAHAGSFCPDLEKEYGRKYIKVRNCKKCGYWQYRHPGGVESPAEAGGSGAVAKAAAKPQAKTTKSARGAKAPAGKTAKKKAPAKKK